MAECNDLSAFIVYDVMSGEQCFQDIYVYSELDKCGWAMCEALTQKEYNLADLLIPDASVEQPRDDFVWCMPILTRAWADLVNNSYTFKTVTPGGLRYLHRIGRGRKQIILVLWHPLGGNNPWKGDVGNSKREPMKALSKSQVEAECAWLRLIKDLQHRIYVVTYGPPPTMQEVINRAMGCDPDLIQSLDSLQEDKA